MFTVGLYTLGCKVSQYETEAIAEGFERAGFAVRPFGESCDAYVINTCTVTAESDRKSRQMIRRALGVNPRAVVAVVGCYSQRAPKELERIEGVSVILGTADKLSVVERVTERLQGTAREIYTSVLDLGDAEFEPMCITKAPRTRAYVKIEDGCGAKCTYCAIAAARGRVRSKRPEDIISEVEGLSRAGTKEIVLTGIETAAYGRDFSGEYDLAELICELDRRGSCERLRLGSLAPELIGESFAEKVKDVKILAHHFHLSVQSGSNRVLAAMKRRYTAEGAMRNIDRLRQVFPNAAFTTDMMVGFPGESEEDFLATVQFTREAKFLDVHVFAYSRRAGTPAANYGGQIDEAVKRRRSAELIAVKNEVREGLLDEVVLSGREMSVILETAQNGVYTGHTDEFIEVSVEAPDSMQGELVRVVPVSHKNGIIRAKLVQ